MKIIQWLKLSFYIMIMLLIHSQGYATTKDRLVLLPLIGEGLKETEKQAYQTVLEYALSSQYEVFSGKQVFEALKNQTEFACTAKNCIENIAIEFQSELVARGRVMSQQENSYILIIKIFNVFEDKVEFLKSQICSPCSNKDVITMLKGMICSQKTSVSEKSSIDPDISGDNISKEAILLIESQPDEADVYLEDILFGRTPLIMSNLKAGQKIQFTLKKKNYHALTVAVTLKVGINDLKLMHLKPMFGTLIIQSEPSESDIFIEGKHEGKTPYINQKFPSGIVLVSVIKDPYEPLENKRIVIRDEEKTRITCQLKSNSSVMIVENDSELKEMFFYGAYPMDAKCNKSYSKTTLITQKIEALNDAVTAYSVPKSMVLKETALVNLLLDFKKSEQEIVNILLHEKKKKGLIVSNYQVESDKLKASGKMKATLKGNNFKIAEISESIQVMSFNDVSEWKWQIKALKEGRQSLHLSLSAIFEIDGKEERKTFRTYDRIIEVVVKNKLKFFFSANWYWIALIITTITAIFTALLTNNNTKNNYKKSKRKKAKRRRKK